MHVRLAGVLFLLSTGVSAQTSSSASEWPQWGGPARTFVVESPGLADIWPEAGPRVIWSRPLGTGHSAIVSDAGRLFTMYRRGNGRTRQGPWDAEETVVALDAATGRTIWEYSYPSPREDFGFGAGPHSTPLVTGGRVFTVGTNKQLHAFDVQSGKVLWSHDLVRAFNAPPLLIRPVVKAGYACSPIAYKDTIICSVGGPGQSVMAFRQRDGAVVWRSGDFLTSEAAPILIDAGGRSQLVVLGGGTINGLDPDDGRVLWSHAHDPGNDLNCLTPLWSDGILFVSSAYKAGSRALRLGGRGDAIVPEEIWFSSRARFMFLNALQLDGHVYGTTGDFGPAFLTALDMKTGEVRWQQRGFSRASLIHADGKTIMLEEDGDLTLATLTPAGMTILSQARVFETTSWTVPTLVGTTLFARDREKITAFDVGGGAKEESAEAPRASALPVAASSPTARPVLSFGGTWALDADRSRIAPATLSGLAASGPPPILHITEAANGTLVIESEINESHARAYVPGVRTATPIAVGTPGTITTTARRDGRTMAAEGTLAPTTGTPAPPAGVREAFTVSGDGTMLTVQVTITTADEKHESSLIYHRTRDVGPCQSWPSPCKRGS